MAVNADGDNPGREGFIWDITVQREAEKMRVNLEAQLRQSQKLEAIGTLAGGVAHEINNPIMGIMSYAKLILDDVAPDSSVAEFATEIGVETNRVAKIVKNMLGFARFDDEMPLSMERPLDIVESTLSLMRSVMRHDQVTLSVNVPDNLPSIRCHSQQIQQVLMNLLTNGRDALNEKYPGYDENKCLSVSAKEISLVNGHSSFGEEGFPMTREAQMTGVAPAVRGIRITVEDHGMGIPDDVRERMFEPFFTTKRSIKGTGLGLSISHSIVTAHGGILRVESEAGEWTRFGLDLPVARESEMF